MKSYDTEQEDFWAGKFGDEYIMRNDSEALLSSKLAFFARVLSKCCLSTVPPPPLTHTHRTSVLEFGSNIGLNLRALGMLLPNADMTAVEINERAAKICGKINRVEVFNGSIFDFETEKQFDLTFTKGVLIHINPDMLSDVYEKLYRYSRRYILVSEYYNPTPVEVPYRGNSDRLFKRDFAGEMMDKYKNLKLVDYGFIYHRDSWLFDDENWFLLEKNESGE